MIGVVNADDIDLPKNYHSKRGHPMEALIDAAENVEWDTLLKAGTFGEPEPIGENVKALRLMWIYKAKCDAQGKLARIKARLVARGDMEKGDLTEAQAYAPVMNFTTVRVMLAVGIQNENTRFHQMDIEGAYVTADALREIYAYLPPGKGRYTDKGKVMLVRKALYGIIDSGRCYYRGWTKFHMNLGFQQIHHDRCYLLYYISENEFIRISFHVDDSIISQVGPALWAW